MITFLNLFLLNITQLTSICLAKAVFFESMIVFAKASRVFVKSCLSLNWLLLSSTSSIDKNPTALNTYINIPRAFLYSEVFSSFWNGVSLAPFSSMFVWTGDSLRKSNNVVAKVFLSHLSNIDTTLSLRMAPQRNTICRFEGSSTIPLASVSNLYSFC